MKYDYGHKHFLRCRNLSSTHMNWIDDITYRLTLHKIVIYFCSAKFLFCFRRYDSKLLRPVPSMINLTKFDSSNLICLLRFWTRMNCNNFEFNCKMSSSASEKNGLVLICERKWIYSTYISVHTYHL